MSETTSASALQLLYEAIGQNSGSLHDSARASLAQALAMLQAKPGRSSDPVLAVVDPTVTVGLGPIGIDINAAGTRAYVANNSGNTVSVIDTTPLTPTVVATVPGLSAPIDVAVTPDGLRVFVTNSGNNTVSVIDTTTNSITGPAINVGPSPFEVAVNPAGTRAYVANHGGTTVSVLDITTNPPTVINSPTVGTSPNGVAVSPNGAQVYVTNQSSNDISVLDATTGAVLVASVAVGGGPIGVAFNPAGTRAYVANNGSGTLTVLDATVTPPTQVAGSPFAGFSQPAGVAVSPDGSLAYIVNFGGDSVSVFDTVANAIITTLPVGHHPSRVAVTPDGNFIYVTNNNDGLSPGTVSVLQIRPIISAVVPSSGPQSGGTLVHIYGSGFNGATAADLGGSALSGFTVTNDSDISGTTTAHVAGTVPAHVTTPLATGTGGSFTYLLPAPAITGIAPDHGPAGVSTQVVITGSNFTGATSVTVNGTPVPFTVDSNSQITATLPPHAAGPVLVTVNTPSGSDSTTFTYAPDRTKLTATPALVQLFPFPQLKFPFLTATLIDLDTGQPIAGATITFKAGAFVLCNATTNAQGIAVCADLLTLPLIILNGGYDAVFAGTPDHQPGSAHAGLFFS